MLSFGLILPKCYLGIKIFSRPSAYFAAFCHPFLGTFYCGFSGATQPYAVKVKAVVKVGFDALSFGLVVGLGFYSTLDGI